MSSSPPSSTTSIFPTIPPAQMQGLPTQNPSPKAEKTVSPVSDVVQASFEGLKIESKLSPSFPKKASTVHQFPDVSDVSDVAAQILAKESKSKENKESEILPLRGKVFHFELQFDKWDATTEFLSKQMTFTLKHDSDGSLFGNNKDSLIDEMGLYGYNDGSLMLQIVPSFSYLPPPFNTKLVELRDYLTKYGIPADIVTTGSISVTDPQLIKRLFKIMVTPNKFPAEINKIAEAVERGTWIEVQQPSQEATASQKAQQGSTDGIQGE